MALIEMHSSWLAINTIIGCSNGCKYCFLQSEGKNLCAPQILCSPSKAVEELLNYKYYNPKIPVCLLPGTDAFLNKTNIIYLINLLDELNKKNVLNDLVLVTKCYIPKFVINKLYEIKKSNRNVVVYLSYSGLGEKFEPMIKEKSIKQNFENLANAGIDIIHYFRPFLPENSSPEKIKNILDFVHNYTNISTIMGLKLMESFIDIIDVWDEIKTNKLKVLQSDAVWPKEAWDFFYTNYSHNQRLYQTNTCAFNTKLGNPSPQYYNSYECCNYNHCSIYQRELCANSVKLISNNIIVKDLFDYLNKLNISYENLKYYFDKNNGLILENVNIDVGTLSYLSYMLGIKVYTMDNYVRYNIYNSSLNGAKPLILSRSKKI